MVDESVASINTGGFVRFRKMASLLLGGMFAAGLSIGLTGAAQASSDPTIPSTVWTEIVIPLDNARANTMCMDVPGGSMSAGTALQFFHCHGSGSDGGPQRWHFNFQGLVANGDRAYQIWNTNSGLCIGFANNSAVAGTRLVQERCDQAPTWTEHLSNANGVNPYIELIALNTNLCMAASNFSDANQTPLVATTCQGFIDPAQILVLG
jgi:hypothetical protein